MQRLRSFFAPVGVISVSHIVGGTAALIAPKAANVSGLAGMTVLGSPPEFTGFILIITGLMAIYSRVYPDDKDVVNALVAPQQAVLMVQFAGVIVAVYHGEYPDGYNPSPDWWTSMWFILADQSPLLAMCLSHTTEVALGGLVNEEREFYQAELKFAQEQLSRCNRCWQMQSEREFWEDIGGGPIAGPNVGVDAS